MNNPSKKQYHELSHEEMKSVNHNILTGNSLEYWDGEAWRGFVNNRMSDIVGLRGIYRTSKYPASGKFQLVGLPWDLIDSRFVCAAVGVDGKIIFFTDYPMSNIQSHVWIADTKLGDPYIVDWNPFDYIKSVEYLWNETLTFRQ